MTTRISSNNLDTTVTAQFGPKISSIVVTDNAYATIDDTAVSVAGGYIVISGSNFATGCTVLIGSLVATSVSFVNSTTVRAQVPAQSAGSYTVYLTNPDGGVAIRVNGLNYSATPTWSTTSPLPGSSLNSAFSIQLSASSNSTVTYALQAGSSLPAGVTLSNVGLLSGTVAGITVETTYNFTVVATDTELQDTPQAFSITISAGDPNFRSTTLLLSGNATTFVRDASTNNFNVTVVGDARPSNLSPYEPGYYSNFFDGTGDYLNLASDASLSMGSENFLVECWCYLTQYVSSGTPTLVNKSGKANVSVPNYLIYGVNGYWSYNIGSSGTSGTTLISRTTTTLVTTNTWHYVVLVKTGTVYSMYLNGVRIGTDTVATVPVDNNPLPLTIGYQTDQPNTSYWYGYISNVRIIKGTLPAGYDATQSSMTVPTAPLSAIANTSLLTCQSNRFIDTSTNNYTVTRFGDTAVSSFVPFVPSSSYATFGSGYFDGTGDYLTVSDSNLALGNGDFTLECWINAPSGLSDKSIFEGRSAGTGTAGFTLTAITATSIRIFSGSALITSGSINYVNTWCHVAVVRASGTTTFYINGVSQGTTTSLGNLTDSSFVIGAGKYATPPNIDAFFTGYISNFRIVKGTAVYTTAFTPPAAPLTAIANTSLLTLQTNQPTNNSMFLDNGTLAHPITRAGNSTQGSFTPYSPSSWSGYFDGTGDYLTVPNNINLTIGSGDFTIECWVYITGAQTTTYGWSVAGPSTNQGSSGWGLVVNRSVDTRGFGFICQNSFVSNDSTYLPVGQWVHLAVTRSGSGANNLKLFKNGVISSQTTYTTTDTYTASPVYIGADGTGGQAFPGYISNFRFVSGTAVYTSAFTPPTAPLTAIANTSLLTLQDNRFMDDSPNNFTITRNGDTRITNFNPFRSLTQTAYYSNYFDGTGDFLTIPGNVAFNLSSGSWTVECWFYQTSSKEVQIISSGAARWRISINTSQQVGWLFNTSSVQTSNNTAPLNRWNHVAVCYNGTTCVMYLNGVAQTATGALVPASDNTSVLYIGRNPDASGAWDFNGYISNARIVKGTAVYTANFTPPTAPLTAISGTSLLTCQSATFVDTSTNNFAITVNGNPYPKIISPFTPPMTTAVQYSALTHGASAYFDGTGDYLTFPYNSTADEGTGAFTWEAWIYPTATPSTASFLVGSAGTNGGFLKINTALTVAIGRRAIADDLTTSTTVTLNQWNHIVAARDSSNTLRIFINGIIGGTSSNNTNNYGPGAATRYIATHDTSLYMVTGYISDYRLVRGQAIYTSQFVPPVQALTAVPNTVFLANFNNGAITDATAKNTLETVGDARISTVVSKFGGSSMFFDGTGDYLYMPNTVNLQFGTGDYTVEFWLNTSSFTGTPVLLDFRTANGATGGGIQISISTAGIVTVYGGSSTATLLVTASSAISTATWVHIALARASNSTRLFINGTQSGSTATDSTSYGLGALWVGSNASGGGNYLTGYIQDLRITKDIARYTANFTAPTAAFQQI